MKIVKSNDWLPLNSLMSGMMSAPPVTGRLPPGQKSFCMSITIKASFAAMTVMVQMKDKIDLIYKYVIKF